MRYAIKRRRLIESGGAAPAFKFDPALATFTAGMAKRIPPGGPFNAAPICQGKWTHVNGTDVNDIIQLATGSKIAGKFYTTLDPYQGSIVLWITPEWNGNDGKVHAFYAPAGNDHICVMKSIDSKLGFKIFSTGYSINVPATVDISSWVSGTTYCVVCSWDTKNTLDGTNLIRISINDVHTFGGATTSLDVQEVTTAGIYVGAQTTTYYPANAIIQGLTIYRRPLYDGTYGVNAGNGDEINLIYAAGAGKDPTLITGSWDVVFCLPTNGTAGALATGTGEAWSHPHSSNVLKRGLDMSYYGGGAWMIKSGGATSRVDCGSEAGLDNLADNAFTAEAWFADYDGQSVADRYIFCKGVYGNRGWILYISSGYIGAEINCATHKASVAVNNSAGTYFKWGSLAHLAITWDDAGDRILRLYINGVLAASSSDANGAIVSDASDNLILGNNLSFNVPIQRLGWARISNSVRYTTAGFVPPRTPPAPDANTLGQWNMTEGTGTTVDNAEGTAGRDGTITGGTWEEQWVVEGTPIFPPSIGFDGANTYLGCGSDAKLDNLHDAAFTAEGWFRPDGLGQSSYGAFFTKDNETSKGWYLSYRGNSTLVAKVWCATAAAQATYTLSPDKRWHHLAITFDDAGDRKVRLYIDRVLVATSAAGTGAVVDDSANVLYIGNYYRLSGAVGWVRISNSVRDIAAETYTRETAPTTDANTMLLLYNNEGVGNPVDQSASPATCTLANGTWNNTPDLAVDSPGARVYPWGQVVGANAANEGIKQTLGELSVLSINNGGFDSDTGWAKGNGWSIAGGVAHHATGSDGSLYQAIASIVVGQLYKVVFTVSNYSAGSINATIGAATYSPPRSANGTYTEYLYASSTTLFMYANATFVGDIDNISVTLVEIGPGAEFRIRALGYSEDGIGKPRLIVYNETGAAAVVTVDGTTTSTEWSPDVIETCFQVPAGCTSLSIKLVNATATGVVGWHKAMMLTNLWADGGVEVGSAWTNILTPTTSAQSNEQAHTGTYSWKVVTDEAWEGVSKTLTAVLGKWYIVTAWVYPVNGIVEFSQSGGMYNDGKLYYQLTSGTGAWKKLTCVVRATSTTFVTQFKSTTSGKTFYVDDVMVRLLDDVSLTVTPASAANSVEGTGIRSCGYDALTQPVTSKLKASKGKIKFKITFRHSSAAFRLFANPYYAYITGDVNNYLVFYASDTNKLKVDAKAQGTTYSSAEWDHTGFFVAGTTYTIELSWTTSKAVLKVDGVVKMTANMAVPFAGAFPATPINFGYPSRPPDAVYSAP